MKKNLIIFLLIPFCAHAQSFNKTSADQFTYKEIGDTVFINKMFLVPGDTLYLGKGSAPDNSFLEITEWKHFAFFSVGQNYLSRDMSGKYPVYLQRKKNSPFSNGYGAYSIIFSTPLYPKKVFTVNWYAAMELHEIKLN